MKREFLTKLLPDAPKEVIDQIMNENGKDIEAQKNTISTLTTERDGLKTQLDTAQAEIRSYAEFIRRKQLVDSGYLGPEYLLSWYFGTTEEEARKMMPDNTGLTFG